MSQFSSPKSVRGKKKKRGLFGLGKTNAPLGDLDNESTSVDNECYDSDGGRGFIPGSQYTLKRPASLKSITDADDSGSGRGRGRGRDADSGRQRSRSVSVTRALKRIVGGVRRKDKEKDKEEGSGSKKSKKKKDKAKKAKRGARRDDTEDQEYILQESASVDESDSEVRLESDGEGSQRFNGSGKLDDSQGELTKRVKKKRKEGGGKKKKRRASTGGNVDGYHSTGSLDLSGHRALDNNSGHGSVRSGGRIGRKPKSRRPRVRRGEGLSDDHDSTGSLGYDLDDGSAGTGKRGQVRRKGSKSQLLDDMFQGSAELATEYGSGGDDASAKSGKSSRSNKSNKSPKSPVKRRRPKRVADTLAFPAVDDDKEVSFRTKRKSFPVKINIDDLRKEVSKRRIQSIDPKLMRGDSSGGDVDAGEFEDANSEEYRSGDNDYSYDSEANVGWGKDPPDDGYGDEAEFSGSRKDGWTDQGSSGKRRPPHDNNEFIVTPKKELDDFDTFRTSWNQSVLAEREEDATVASMAETVDDLSKQLDFQKKETEDAKAQLADALEMVSQLTDDLNRAARTGEELVDVKRELNVLSDERVKLRASLERLEDELVAKEERIEDLENIVENQLDRVEFLEEKLEQTEDDMFNLEDEVKRLEDEKQITVLDDYDKRLKARGSMKVERQERRSLILSDSNKIKGRQSRAKQSRQTSGDGVAAAFSNDLEPDDSRNLSSLKGSRKAQNNQDARALDGDDSVKRKAPKKGATGSKRAELVRNDADFERRIDSLDAWEKELEQREKRLDEDRELDEMKERRLDDWERELEEREVFLTQQASLQDGNDDGAKVKDLLQRERELEEDRKTLEAEKLRLVQANLQFKQDRNSITSVDEQVEVLEHENKSMQRNFTGELFQTRLQLKKKDDEIFILRGDLKKAQAELTEENQKKIEEELLSIESGVNKQLRDLDDRNNLLQAQLQEEKEKSAKATELEGYVQALEEEKDAIKMEKEQLESDNTKLRGREEARLKQQEKNKAKEEANRLLQLEMTKQLDELDEENRELTKKLAGKEAELEDMLLEKDAVISDLKDTLEVSKKSIGFNDAGEDMTTLLNDLEDLKMQKRAVDKLERELARARTQAEGKDLLIESAEQQISRLKEDLDLVMTDTEEMKEKADRVDELERKLALAEEELEELKVQLSGAEKSELKIKESFTELLTSEARRAEGLEKELQKYLDEDEQADGPTKTTTRLRRDLKSLKEDYKSLKRQFKTEQQKAAQHLKKKDESVKFFQDELMRLKEESKKSKASDKRGAERRIMELEDELYHWKSVNRNLEDEVSLWKAEADEWKAKADGRGIIDDDDDDQSTTSASIASQRRPYYNEGQDPLQHSQHSLSSMTSKEHLFYVSDKVSVESSSSPRDDSASQRAARSVANLWSTLVTPKGPPTSNNTAIPSYFSG